MTTTDDGTRLVKRIEGFGWSVEVITFPTKDEYDVPYMGRMNQIHVPLSDDELDDISLAKRVWSVIGNDVIGRELSARFGVPISVVDGSYLKDPDSPWVGPGRSTDLAINIPASLFSRVGLDLERVIADYRSEYEYTLRYLSNPASREHNVPPEVRQALQDDVAMLAQKLGISPPPSHIHTREMLDAGITHYGTLGMSLDVAMDPDLRLAIAAHELTHFILGHHTTKPGSPAQDRRDEYLADLGAAQLTGDPDAVIRSLRLLGHWSPIFRKGMRVDFHPTMSERIRVVDTIGRKIVREHRGFPLRLIQGPRAPGPLIPEVS